MSKEKVRLSPDKISDKWGKNLKGAVAGIVEGVDRVTEDPGQKAVDQQEKMREKINDAIDSGLWAARRLAVSMSDWKEKTKKKVKERLSSGVDGAMPKRKAFDTWLASRLNAILPEIAGMPSMTLQDSKDRVGRLMDHMAAERYKG